MFPRHSTPPVLFLVACAGVLPLCAEDAPVRIPELAVIDTRLGGSLPGSTQASLDGQAGGLSWSEVTRTASNLHFNDSGAGTFGAPAAVRGLASTPYFGDSALTFYVGDIPLAGPAATPSLLPGLTSVTWVRGPQATFSLGRATTGGTALLRLHDGPVGGSVQLLGGDGGQRGAEATQSYRQGSFSAQVGLGLYQRDGYIRNTTLGETVGDQDHRGANVSLRWQARAGLEFSLQWIGSEARDGAQPLAPLDGPLFDVERPAEGEARSDFHGLAFRATQASDLGTISLISSYTRWNLDPYQNTLVLPPQIDSTLRQDQGQFAQELRWLSPKDAAFAWSGGAFWSEGKTEGDVLRTLFGFLPIEGSAYRIKQRTLAVYGQSVLMAEDGWVVDAGIRAEQQKRRIERQENVPAKQYFGDRFAKTQVTPRVNVSHDLGRNRRLTASWSEAYKPGGYSAYTSREELARFSSERTRAWEVSWESQFSRRLPYTLRAFRYDVNNYQVERSFTETDYLVVNADRARSEGVEVETRLAVNRSLSLTASAGWVRARLKDFTDPFTGVSYANKPLPFAPAMTARVEATTVLGGGFSATAGTTWTGRTYFTEAGDARYSQNHYELYDARVDYQRGRWRVTLRGENLSDEKYRSLIVPGIDHAVPGAPRRWSAEISYRW